MRKVIMDNPLRTLAMYLPQFHQIEENDKWWGNGYTEWTAVKSAKPLFPHHRQPRIPLGHDYYNLLDRDTLKKQAEMAAQYGVSGFCFYHYWFGKNRKILEKPAENLLKWKEINLPFCFCWDPSQWARTWTRLGNSWADKFETNRKKQKNNDNGILIKQDFGDETYWRAHFDYLAEFFADNRYIKMDGKPVFIFYASIVISCFERMIAKWRKWSVEKGFPGLYIIVFDSPNEAADAVILPMAFSENTFGYDAKQEYLIPGTSLRGYDYDAVWQNYLSYMPVQSQQTLWLGTVDFDDTPRRGLNGRVYTGVTPEKFKKYFSLLVEKSRQAKNPFVFIDAWNEWGEGKYLEPDTVYKFEYLEAVKQVLDGDYRNPEIKDCIALDWEKQAGKLENQLLKKNKTFQLIDTWLMIKSHNIDIAQQLNKMGWHHIAIYGCGKYGRMFYDEISGTSDNVNVDYFIDLHSDGLRQHFKKNVYSPDEDLPVCDCIVVSIVREFYNVLTYLRERTNIPVISLYEILDEVYENRY